LKKNRDIAKGRTRIISEDKENTAGKRKMQRKNTKCVFCFRALKTITKFTHCFGDPATNCDYKTT